MLNTLAVIASVVKVKKRIAKYTKATSFNNGSNEAEPKSKAVVTVRQNTPNGVYWIIIVRELVIIFTTKSRKFTIFSRCSV